MARRRKADPADDGALLDRIAALQAELHDLSATVRGRAGVLELSPRGALDTNHAIVTADKTTGIIGASSKIPAAQVQVADAGNLLTATTSEAAFAEVIGLSSTVILQAGAMVIVSGGASLSQITSPTICWLFDANSGEAIGGYARLPWTNFQTRLVWAPSDASAGDVVWEITRSGMASGATPSSSTYPVITSTAPGVTNQLVITPLTTSVAVPAGELTGFRVTRRAGDAADTYAADAKFAALLLTRA